MIRLAAVYGGLIAAGVAAWVVLKHLVIGGAPPWIDPLVFSACHLACVVAGLRARRAADGALSFGAGVKTGMAISAVYAVAASAFFAVAFAVMGPALLQQAGEPGVGERSTAHVLAGAFTGLVVGALVSGLTFSLIVAAIMRRAKSP